MSDIQELENRIEQFKSMLSRMQYDLKTMESELRELKSAEGIRSTEPVQQSIVQPEPVAETRPVQPQQVQPQPQQIQPHQPQQVQNTYIPQQPAMQYNDTTQQQVPIQPVQARPAKTASKLGTEALLGKSIMGIAASVLIFISLILFATLIIPNLTETLKLILMYGVSIIVTAVGLTQWIRKNSTFFLSIGACGVGSIYISLFLTHSYFHMIDKVALYILIFFWAAGVLYLSTRKQRLFETIGNVGIFISVIFGTVSCTISHDPSMMIVLIIYFIIGTLAYTIFRIKDRISFLINSLSAVLSSIVLLIGCLELRSYIVYSELPYTDVYFMLGILAAFCLGMMLLALFREREVKFLPVTAGFAFCVIHLLSVRVMLLSDTNLALDVTLFILCSVYYIFIEVFTKKLREIDNNSNIIFYMWKGVLLLLAVIHFCNLNDISEYIGVFVFIIPLLVYGYISNDRFSKIAALCLYGVLVFNVYMNVIMLFVYVLSVFIIANVLGYMYKNQYSTAIKCIFYILFMLGLTVSVFNIAFEYDLDLQAVCTFMIFLLGGLNLAAAKTVYGKHWLTMDDEKSMTIISYIINAILMIYAIAVIYDVDDPYAQFFTTIGLIGLALINSVSLLRTKNTAKSIYVGVKFTILLIVILDSYSVPNYVLSVAAFLLAIAFIIVGFAMNVKSLRLYGLIVSMIFIFKLVMVDITYNNTLGNAASFFISGVLCFVISAMYNLADKKMNKEENEKTEKTIS